MDTERQDYELFMSEELKDYFGIEILVGDRLARAVVYCSNASEIEMRTVTSIANGKIYLDNSKVSIKYPQRSINISALRTGRWAN